MNTEAFRIKFHEDVRAAHEKHKYLLDGIAVELNAPIGPASEGLAENYVFRQGNKINAECMTIQMLIYFKHAAGEGGVISSPTDHIIFSDAAYGILEGEMLALVGFFGTIKRKAEASQSNSPQNSEF